MALLKAVSWERIIKRCAVCLLVIAHFCLRLPPQQYKQYHTGPSVNIHSTNTTICTCVDCQEDKVCGGLWHGLRYPAGDYIPTIDEFEEVLHKRILIVVAHCKTSLDWMENYIYGFPNVVNIHIISKCGHKVEGAPLNATVETNIPNVGREGQSYAYYISSVLPTLVNNNSQDNDIVVFLTDTTSESVHQKQLVSVDFKSMIRGAASSNGFACNLIPKDKSMSAYHDKAQLFTFNLQRYKKGERDYKHDNNQPVVPFRSNYKTFGDFYNNVLKNANPRPDLVQVCFGGGFASSLENILKQDAMVWKSLEKAQTRGDNIQEVHYGERAWAILLANPLEPYQIKALRNYSTSLMNNGNGPLIREIIT